MRLLITLLSSLLLLFLSHPTLAVKLDGYDYQLKPELSDITAPGLTGLPNQKHIAYTRMIEYPPNTEPSNEQLAGLARQFYEEMVVKHQQWIDKCDSKTTKKYAKANQPKVVAVAAYGNLVYMSTNIKQSIPGLILQHPDSTLSQAITESRDAWLEAHGVDPNTDAKKGADAHKFFGVCAEIMVMSMILQRTGQMPRDLIASGWPIRIVAWAGRAEKVIDPCDGKFDDPERNPQKLIGCNQVLHTQGMIAIPEGTRPRKFQQKYQERFSVNLADVWTIGSTSWEHYAQAGPSHS